MVGLRDGPLHVNGMGVEDGTHELCYDSCTQ
jgi:hypothetical protein